MIGASTWQIRGGRVLGPAPFLLAGIVNVTPDSFYDGGSHATADAAIAHGRMLARAGAAMLDVGGESTRPGAPPVPQEEELARVLPVVQALAKLSAEDVFGTAPVVSVDTYKAAVAAQALEAGAVIVNDVSACRFDPELLDVLAQYRPGYVLMHSQGSPETMQQSPTYDDIILEILEFFEQGLAMLTASGLPEDNIVLDPGIGFGKLMEHNVAILRDVERFGRLGRPVYMGLSNKSLWGSLLGLGTGERAAATATATALLVARGVWLHRVHDVEQVRQAARIAAAVSPSLPGTPIV